MLKLTGCLFIILSGMGLNYAIRDAGRRHIMMLYELRRSFADIANEMTLSMQPAGDILRRISVRYDAALTTTFINISDGLKKKNRGTGDEVWRDEFHAAAPHLMLSDDESVIIEGAGTVFFGTSVEGNAKGAEHLISLVDEKIAGAKEKRAKDERLCGILCMSASFALILIFL